ncbi:hypothetical protein [Leucobacter sp. G161]|uniref:hypothetical protein n=1 Tax=Leucobacter sp. G161 TaxID=663704 RepID=UPI00073C562C|nr:hypothetical protein [Leucobacter sp. G161]KUF05705.1 hypothetical protein AUL38_16045 [Leucobacter sp. G161]
MAWTESSDVVGSWIGDGAPADTVKLESWIDKAEREIKFRVPGIQERIDAEAPGTDLLETAKDVVVSMVTRVFRNPEGIRQTNLTSGPFTTSKTYGGDLPGGLSLTDDELAKLQGQRGGAFTVSMIPPWSPFAGWPS